MGLARPWAIACPSLPVSFSQNARLRSVTVFGRSLISPDDRVMYEGVRVFWGRFFARGLGASCTTDLDPKVPSRVFMLLRSTLVMESWLMSPVKTNLPQLFRFFSLMLDSHATI